MKLKKIVNFVGMGLKCRISYRRGVATVTNVDGTPSALYQNALNLTGKQKEALDIWATASLDSFETITSKKNNNDEVTLEEVLQYYNNQISTTQRLSPSDTIQISHFMATNGFTRLSDLRTVLNQIFRPQGETTTISNSGAKASGLYGSEELQDINLTQISDLLNRIDGELLHNDFEVEPDTATMQKYKDTRYKTILGTYEVVDQETVDKEVEDLLDEFTSKEFYVKIQELPYQDFVDKFYNDDSFAEETIGRFEGLKRLPILDASGDTLTISTSPTYATVKNTLRSDINHNIIQSELEYLKSIELDVWNDSAEQIQEILGEIEANFAELNLDVIGLKAGYKSRENVIDLLDSLNNMVTTPSDANIKVFAEKHDALITKKRHTVVEKFSDTQQTLNIVKVYSDKSDDELFERFGLLKIGDNTYHKIDRNADKNDLYEYLYDEVINDRLVIPKELLITSNYKDILKKPEILESIAQFVNQRETGIQARFQEEISLYQLIFEHPPITPTDTKQGISPLQEIQTNEQYLKTDFISDFYNYILEEKLKDSLIYRKTLSKFEINDQDITLVSPVESIDNLEYSEELQDYIRLKRSPEMKYLVSNEDMTVPEDLLYINEPQMAPQQDGTYSIDGNYLITTPNGNNFVRAKGKLYQKIMSNENTHLYLEVLAPINSVYYTSNTDFNFNQVDVNRMMAKYNSTKPKAEVDPIIESPFIKEEITNDATAILESGINIVTSYPDSKEAEIYNKIDNCE